MRETPSHFVSVNFIPGICIYLVPGTFLFDLETGVEAGFGPEVGGMIRDTGTLL